MPEIIIRKGSVIGRNHYNAGRNNQDHAVIKDLGGYNRLGILCDGCSSGAHSEIGSFLISEFLGNRIKNYCDNAETPIWALQASYQDALTDVLENIVNIIGADSSYNFVFDALRATIFGVLCVNKETIIFYQGDGKYYIDGIVETIDQNNTPTYMAYEIPQILNEIGYVEGLGGFNIVRVNSGWKRIAIASDGVPDNILEEIWGEKHKASLQRKLNVLFDRKIFSDDATIVAIERFGEIDDFSNFEFKEEGQEEDTSYNQIFALAKTMVD